MSSVIADYRALKSYADLLSKKAALLDSEANFATQNLKKLGNHHQDAVYDQLSMAVIPKIQDLRIFSQILQAHAKHLINLIDPLSRGVSVLVAPVEIALGASTQVWIKDISILSRLLQANDTLYDALAGIVQQVIQTFGQQLQQVENWLQQAENAASDAKRQLEDAKAALYSCESRPSWVDKHGHTHYPNCRRQESSVQHWERRSSKCERIADKCRDVRSTIASEARSYESSARSLLQEMDRYRLQLEPLLQKMKMYFDQYLDIRQDHANAAQWTMSGEGKATNGETHRSKGNYSSEIAITTLETGQIRQETITANGDALSVEFEPSSSNKFYSASHFTLNGEIIKFKTNLSFSIDERRKSTLRIKNIELLDEHQGKKIGASLIESIEAFARQKNFKYLEGEAENAGAESFFKKLGFDFPNPLLSSFEKKL